MSGSFFALSSNYSLLGISLLLYFSDDIFVIIVVFFLDFHRLRLWLWGRLSGLRSRCSGFSLRCCGSLGGSRLHRFSDRLSDRFLDRFRLRFFLSLDWRSGKNSDTNTSLRLLSNNCRFFSRFSLRLSPLRLFFSAILLLFGSEFFSLLSLFSFLAFSIAFLVGSSPVFSVFLLFDSSAIIFFLSLALIFFEVIISSLIIEFLLFIKLILNQLAQILFFSLLLGICLLFSLGFLAFLLRFSFSFLLLIFSFSLPSSLGVSLTFKNPESAPSVAGMRYNPDDLVSVSLAALFSRDSSVDVPRDILSQDTLFRLLKLLQHVHDWRSVIAQLAPERVLDRAELALACGATVKTMQETFNLTPLVKT